MRVRLAVLQLLGVLSLALWLWSGRGGTQAGADFDLERYQFWITAEWTLRPLGFALLCYVLWALVLRAGRLAVRARRVRAALGAAAALPVLLYLLGAAGYWNGGPFPAAQGFFFRLALMDGLEQPAALGGLCADMLLLALAVETRPERVS